MPLDNRCITQHNRCIMQQKRPLDYLMPRVRQQVLTATLVEPPREWYIADLGKRLRLHHATLQREITALHHAGILRVWRQGNRTYFAPDPACPILPELRALLTKTVALADRVREALSSLRDRIDIAFVYGSIASGEENPSSDVDLMVIGDVTLTAIVEQLRSLEKDLGREVNPSLYSREELATKLNGHSHFLSSVMAAPKLFLIGDDHDLARLAQQRIHQTPQHLPGGTVWAPGDSGP